MKLEILEKKEKKATWTKSRPVGGDPDENSLREAAGTVIAQLNFLSAPAEILSQLACANKTPSPL
jgi:hypothetical protein